MWPFGRDRDKKTPSSPAPKLHEFGGDNEMPEQDADLGPLDDGASESAAAPTSAPSPPPEPPPVDTRDSMVNEDGSASKVRPGVKGIGTPAEQRRPRPAGPAIPGSRTYPEDIYIPETEPVAYDLDAEAKADHDAQIENVSPFPPPSGESTDGPMARPQAPADPPAPAPRPSLALQSTEPPAPALPETPASSSVTDDATTEKVVTEVASAEAPPVDEPVRAASAPPLPANAERLILGAEPTTFGKEPWWSSRNYRKLPMSGPPDDLVVRSGTFGNLAAMGCSSRGTKHCPYGEPNDDFFTTSVVNDPEQDEPAYLVAVVCDGMGSAEFSSFSARILAEATAACLANIATHLWPLSLTGFAELFSSDGEKILGEISDVVRGAASLKRPSWLQAQSHIPPTDVSDRHLQSTLTFAIVKIAKIGEASEALIGYVGDSPALSIKSGEIHNLFEDAQSSGVFSTATDGAIGATSISLIEHTIDAGTALLLATDGVANFLTYERQPTNLGAYVAEHWSRPLPQMAFIRDMDFDLPSADDDRTALVIWARD